MSRRIVTCLKIFLMFFAFHMAFSQTVMAKNHVINLNDPKSKNIVLAKIGNEPITVGELVDFGKSSPAFYGYLQIPGGPDKLLRELVLERLLLLEGKARKIQRPAGKDKTIYLLKIKRELLPPLPPVTDKEAREYYEKHPSEFSTPLLLRLSQIKIFFNERNKKEAKKQIEKALEELGKGVPFEKVAEKYSQEPISKARGGDIGFIPSTALGSKEVSKAIIGLKKGQISQILTIGNSYTIVKLTDRREPITDPFEQVKEIARQKAQQAREEARIEKLRAELEKKWKVTYLDK